MAPVEVLIDKPEGSAGEIEYANGAVPPEPVTGVKEVAAALDVRVSVAMTRVVDNPVEITRANVFALIAPLTSVAVTV
jgi:hypothetical protein